MTDSRLKAWVALGLALTAHPRLRRGRGLEGVDPEAIVRGEGCDPSGAPSLRPDWVKAIFSGGFPDWADKQIKASRRLGVGILTFEEGGYPQSLRRLPDPPPFLFVKGGLTPRDDGAVAVVGSRGATPYGLGVAQDLGRALALAGITVVSGLARGIDTAAQRGAIEAGGRTLGVLGCGIDVIYPKENRRMFAEVARTGALVSEHAFGAGPHARHFPARNRIIAGLSAAVVVVEATRWSGSLITARLAADEMGLPVCAVPGSITSRTSEGCNDLIFDGATPVRGVMDVLGTLPEDARERASAALTAAISGAAADQSAAGLDPAALRVLGALDRDQPRCVDELAVSVGLASGPLLGHLLELELRGLAVQHAGGRYLRAR